jgi:hypothetical protein
VGYVIIIAVLTLVARKQLPELRDDWNGANGSERIRMAIVAGIPVLIGVIVAVSLLA